MGKLMPYSHSQIWDLTRCCRVDEDDDGPIIEYQPYRTAADVARQHHSQTTDEPHPSVRRYMRELQCILSGQ